MVSPDAYHHVMRDVFGQPATALFVAPLFNWNVDIFDGAIKRGRVLCSKRMHVERLWSCQFVDIAERFMPDLAVFTNSPHQTYEGVCNTVVRLLEFRDVDFS